VELKSIYTNFKPTASDTSDQYKKCIICTKYYTINSATACRYHSGKYGFHEHMSNKFEAASKWVCCKKIAREDEGCCVGAHIEDLDTSNNLNKFSVAVEQNNKVNNLMEQIRKENNEKGKYAEKSSPEIPSILILPQGYETKPREQDLINFTTTPKEGDTPTENLYTELNQPPKEPKETYYYNGHVFHKVIAKDTLQGLVLRYNAKIDQIKKDNQIFGDNIYSKKWLKIRVDKTPPAMLIYNDAPSTGTTARTFQKAAGCSFEEANYYISECGGDFKAALELYKSDISWEKKSR